MDWPTLYHILNTHNVRFPPFNWRMEAWLWQDMDLRRFYESGDLSNWYYWLSNVLAGEVKGMRFPPVLFGVDADVWREQANRAEDARERCPDGEWLTEYVTYLHVCAEIIEAVQKTSIDSIQP